MGVETGRVGTELDARQAASAWHPERFGWGRDAQVPEPRLVLGGLTSCGRGGECALQETLWKNCTFFGIYEQG